MSESIFVQPTPSVILERQNKSVAIYRITWKKLPVIAKALGAITKHLSNAAPAEGESETRAVSATIVTLLSEDLPEIETLIITLSDVNREDLPELELDDVVRLVTAIIEVNVSFFTDKVWPQIQTLLAKINQSKS